MTHPTPEQVDGAIERLRSAMHEYAMPDGCPTPRANVESSDLAILLSVVERQREALEELVFWVDRFLNEECDSSALPDIVENAKKSLSSPAEPAGRELLEGAA